MTNQDTNSINDIQIYWFSLFSFWPKFIIIIWQEIPNNSVTG